MLWLRTCQMSLHDHDVRLAFVGLERACSIRLCNHAACFASHVGLASPPPHLTMVCHDSMSGNHYSLSVRLLSTSLFLAPQKVRSILALSERSRSVLLVRPFWESPSTSVDLYEPPVHWVSLYTERRELPTWLLSYTTSPEYYRCFWRPCWAMTMEATPIPPVELVQPWDIFFTDC